MRAAIATPAALANLAMGLLATYSGLARVAPPDLLLGAACLMVGGYALGMRTRTMWGLTWWTCLGAMLPLLGREIARLAGASTGTSTDLPGLLLLGLNLWALHAARPQARQGPVN